ncbi:MAG TPA: DUF1786 domain-containing protein [Thermomicrobiaceae bacterium]|nr:DUF1786 domain-containing protein [Thermomicrobiaceae bacterium]
MTRDNPLRILAIDVGAGTQDILLYESDRTPENCIKLVLPSQTQVIARRIAAATARGVPLHLSGQVMGGGASSEAVERHLAAGLPVSAAPAAARTLHNDLERVAARGVVIRDEAPPGAEVIELVDVDRAALEAALGRFEVALPERFAIAVQDHGYLPGAGGREFRYEFLQSLLRDGGELTRMAFREPPAYMLRMRAVRELLPGAVVMDTGAAAVLGSLGDPRVAEAVTGRGAVLVNIGNMHTFGIAVRGRRIRGLFEHHTGGITPDNLRHLVDRLRGGTLTHEEVVAWGGHGAAFAADYGAGDELEFVAITGPQRQIGRALGYHESVPHGDMMLAGPFGLVEGTLHLLAREGEPTGLSLIAG